MSKKILKFSILLIILTVFLSACTLPWKKKAALVNQETASSTPENATSSEISVPTKQLKKFLNISDLNNFLKDHSSADNFRSNDSAHLTSNSPFANYRADSRDASAPDIIKINSDYTYSLVRNELIITKNRPVAEARVLSRINFESRPENILVSGNSLLVYGVDSKILTGTLYKSFQRQNTYTYLKVYDISDPASPKLVRDLNFEGVYESARLVGDYLYFLTDTPGTYVDGEPLLPRVLDNGEVLNQVCETGTSRCFAPEVYYFDVVYNSYRFANISVINLKDNNETIGGQVYLLGNSQDSYLSLSNLYITYTDSVDEYGLEQMTKREIILPKLNAVEKDKIAKIEAAPDYILNDNEKKLKAGTIFDNYLSSLSADELLLTQASIDDGIKQKISASGQEAGKTSIYRFSLANKISYEAIGGVKGQLIDNYSMDENGAYFRIATVSKPSSSTDSSQNGDFYSNLYVLDKDLKTVGGLENLATSAAIKATRFIGNRAYLSTAKEDDPLYIISLSDPAKLAVLGAIKIPGNSRYLLPYDPNGNKLISFGKETGAATTNASSSKGIKLSLFDFTDLQKPKEIDNYIIGDETSDSIALSDLATLNYFYSEAKNLLIVPAVLREKGLLNFAGVLVFSLVDNRLVLKGRIDHSYGGHFTDSDTFNGFNYYDNTVKRAIYSNDSDDLIYTFSNKLLKINKFTDLSSVKDIILTSGSDDNIITQSTGTNVVGAPTSPAEIPASSPVPDAAQVPASSTQSPTLPNATSSSPL